MKVLGLDIGGTYIKYMLKDNGKVIAVHETLSHASEGAGALLKVVYRICDEYDFDLLGVSTAGMVAKDGSIYYASENIPRYTGVRLKWTLEKKYKCKAYILNDVHAAAMAEVSKDRKDYYFISLGTGIGGALVLNGKVYGGNNNIAGHICFWPSVDGKNVCDKTASVSGLKSLTKISPRYIFTELKKGNKEAIKVMKQWCKEVAHVIAMVVCSFNPKTIVLAGGITRQGQELLDEIKKEFDIIPKALRNTFELVIAKDEGYSGAIGAIKYAERMYEEENSK